MSTNHIESTTPGGISVTTREELTHFFAMYGGQISQYDRRELLRFYCKEVAKMNKRRVVANLEYYEPEDRGDYYYPDDDYPDRWYTSFDCDLDGDWEKEYELFANSDDGKKYSIFNTQYVPRAGDYKPDDEVLEAWEELCSYGEDAWDYNPLVVKSTRHAKRFVRQPDGSFKRDSNRRNGQIRMNKTLCYRREATFEPWVSASARIENRVRDRRYSRYNFKVNRHPHESKNTCNVGNAWRLYVEYLEWELEDSFYDFLDDDMYQITWADVDDENDGDQCYNEPYRNTHAVNDDDYDWYDYGWDDTQSSNWREERVDNGSGNDSRLSQRVKFPSEPMNYWFNPWHRGHRDVISGDEVYRIPARRPTHRVPSNDCGYALGDLLAKAIRHKKYN